MKKRITLLVVLCFLVAGAASSYAQMTDRQIISYIKQSTEAGKSSSQIGKELIARGATVEQLTRLKEEYDSPDYGKEEFKKDSTSRKLSKDERLRFLSKTTEVKKHEAKPEKEDSLKIYGHDIFSTGSRLSFEPNENAATPANYVLGPGDEVIIDVWGQNETSIKETVSPDGKISISQIGPVILSGLTITEAEAKLKRLLSQKYSFYGDESGSDMSLTLGKIRTVKVNVLGEVSTPGTYRLSSLSTVFNALYKAGGIRDIGSLRDIKLMRGGEVKDNIDLYEFIFRGARGGNTSLQDDDVIIVPAFSGLVEVSGGVKRPMLYEAKDGEPIAAILDYAGGFASDASTEEVTVQRRNGNGGQVFTVPSKDFGSFGIRDGDKISVHTNSRNDLFENKVEIKGSVVRPGIYALGSEIATVRQLVGHAGGLLDNAFEVRAQIIREKPDRSMEVLAIAVGSIMQGKSEDILLRRNDLVVISDSNEMNPKGPVSITGFIRDPGDYEFADGMSVEDLIMMAGGLESGASTARVEVSRRIFSPESTESRDTLAQIFTFELKDSLSLDGMPSLILEPYDVVSVRKSPTYVEQKRVTISGEVQFPGEYTLVTNNDRLTDIFKRAGGSTPNAFVSGAILKREFSEAEKIARKRLAIMAASQEDSTNIKKISQIGDYSVGIDLGKALENPGGEYDVVLCDGDEIIVPPAINTVRIQGEVLYPNAVNYLPGKPVSYYISQAGGYSNDAKRADVYVVYMNGQVARGSAATVEPGCEIVVPVKSNKKKMSVGEIISISSAAVSLTTVVVTLINILK